MASGNTGGKSGNAVRELPVRRNTQPNKTNRESLPRLGFHLWENPHSSKVCEDYAESLYDLPVWNVTDCLCVRFRTTHAKVENTYG